MELKFVLDLGCFDVVLFQRINNHNINVITTVFVQQCLYNSPSQTGYFKIFQNKHINTSLQQQQTFVGLGYLAAVLVLLQSP